MPRFVKKPIVIEARRFETNNDSGICLDRIVLWIALDGGEAYHDGTSIFIRTLEGQMRADCGDWIIRGVRGEFYPCKPDIFEATYGEVEEEATPDHLTEES